MIYRVFVSVSRARRLVVKEITEMPFYMEKEILLIEVAILEE